MLPDQYNTGPMALPVKLGYLELITGPMYSGKTSRLLTVFKQAKLCNTSVLVVNYSGDTRYSDTNLSTHDRIEIPCVFLESLSALESEEDLKVRLDEAKVILINEGQFFGDLFSSVQRFVEQLHKHVYVCGLDGDYRREPFGDLLRLIPIADSIIKLKSLCQKCCDGTPALFSHRVQKGVTEQKLIGTDAYAPLCRKCYLALNT